MTAGAVNTWSTTAATNATADSTVNWAEGQAPSSVNDSARAMMASLAKYRDDISGGIVTGGTSSAYTVTSNQGFASTPSNGQMIAFIPHATCAAGATLNVDGGGPRNIGTTSANPVLAGELVANTPYVATYRSSSSAWVLQGFYGNPYGVPLGGGMLYFGTSAPNSSFVFPFGQAISRTTYATLFALTSTTYGVGDGSTTFNLPDLRGRIPAGKDNMGGSTASRLTSTYYGADPTAIGAVSTGGQSTTLVAAHLPAYTPTGSVSVTGVSVTYPVRAWAASGVADNTRVSLSMTGGSDLGTLAATASGTASFSGTAAAGQISTPFSNIQPSIICNYIIRVL